MCILHIYIYKNIVFVLSCLFLLYFLLSARKVGRSREYGFIIYYPKHSFTEHLFAQHPKSCIVVVSLLHFPIILFYLCM